VLVHAHDERLGVLGRGRDDDLLGGQEVGAGRGDCAELAGRLDDVLGARAGPIELGRVALAKEGDAAAVELKGEAVGRDGEVIGVRTAAMGRVERCRGRARGGVSAESNEKFD